jgi:hypothetical protein
MAVSWLAIDLHRRQLSMRSADGRSFEIAMPPDMLTGQQNLRRVEMDVDTGRLAVSMAGEPSAIVELRRPEVDLDALRAGRPIVYLDQNHWSTLAAVRHGQRPAREDEVEPARRLMDLDDAERVLLPVSAAHLVETTPLHGAPRVALAGTVLALGRGWQMRNPLHVRAEEVLRALTDAEPAAAEVFAPGADGFFGSRPGGSSGSGLEAGASPQVMLQQLSEVVPAVLGLYEAMLDEQAIADEDGRAEAAAEGWAVKFAELAHGLHEADEPASMVRRIAYANLHVDLMDDIVRVANAARTSPEAVIDRLCADDDPTGRMPFLGQMRQMLFARLRNARQRWEVNDLVDIMFLCCAAGYADLVVGERRAVGYLRQARHPPPRARLATSLREAVELLDAMLS